MESAPIDQLIVSSFDILVRDAAESTSKRIWQVNFEHHDFIALNIPNSHESN